MQFSSNGYDIDGRDLSGRREDLSFIVRFNWQTSHHLKEAIQVLLAARLENACNSGTSGTSRKHSDLLDEMEFRKIRLQIASNPNTPPVVLEYLARHSDTLIQERIAENPRCTREVLMRLANSPSADVRTAVAENPLTPQTVLQTLASDPDTDVRYSLAENSNLSEELLLVLCRDENPYVRSRAARTLQRMHGGQVRSADFYKESRPTDMPQFGSL